MKVVVACCLALSISACTTVRNEASCSDGHCLDPARPYCDTDGSFGGEPNTCVAITCQADQLVRCDANLALVCNATGDNIVTTDCGRPCDPQLACNECVANTSRCDGNDLLRCGGDGRLAPPDSCEGGCVDGAEPRCAYLEPLYVPDACDDLAASPMLRFDADTTFDVDDDTNCNGGVVTQTAGPSICVVRHGAITIEPGVTVRVSGTRVLAFVSDDEVAVHGTLDLSASSSVSGPGASSVAVTSAGAGAANSGGGGAGAATAGAAGGGCCSGGTGGGAAGGGTSLRPTALAFVKGGPSATVFGVALNRTANGGGGGGAATLIACRGTVAIDSTGLIAANGGGGLGARVIPKPDNTVGNMFVPAGGGGGGGAVVFQGLNVSLKGALFANGGGGGGGRSTDINVLGAGISGGDGRNAVGAASGGSSSQGAGAGGAGGFGGAAPAAGGASTSTMMAPGGGGGSVGFFEVVAPANGQITIAPVAASPSVLPVVTASTR